MAVPEYGQGRVSAADVRQLLAAFNVDVIRASIDTPAILTPPVANVYRLIVADWVGPAVARHIELHELGHVLCGDAQEPTFLKFTGPLPEAEEVADLFALSGIIDAAEAEQGSEYVEALIRQRVPLEDRGWQTYRIPDLAPKVVRMRTLIEERL